MLKACYDVCDYRNLNANSIIVFLEKNHVFGIIKSLYKFDFLAIPPYIPLAALRVPIA